MPPIAYVLIALAVVAVLFFLLRKKGDDALPEADAPKPLPTPKYAPKAQTKPKDDKSAKPAAEGEKPDEDDKDPYEGIAPEELPPDLQYDADSSVSFPTNI